MARAIPVYGVDSRRWHRHAPCLSIACIVEWLSKDPIGISGGLNQYVAFRNNPVNLRDWSGLRTDDSYVFDDNLGPSILFDPTIGFYFSGLILILAPEPGSTATGLIMLFDGIMTDLGFDQCQLDLNLLPDNFYRDQINRTRNWFNESERNRLEQNRRFQEERRNYSGRGGDVRFILRFGRW